MRVKSLDTERILMTEGRLDALGDRFVRDRVRELLGVAFERYLSDPEYFDEMVERMRKGEAGLQRRDMGPSWYMVFRNGLRVRVTGMN